MIPLDRDTLTSLAGLEALALAGILLPLFVGHFLHPAAGLVLALVWWATPGAPVQILHDFRRGWYPFLAAVLLRSRGFEIGHERCCSAGLIFYDFASYYDV